MAKYGTVKDFGVSRSQKPRVLIHEDGQPEAQWYSLGTTKMDGVRPGDRISFEPNMSNFNGVDIWFVGKYAKEPDSTAPPVTLPSQPGLSGPAPNLMTEGERAFCSNVIAHAIDAKLITAHTDLSTWVRAALNALRHHDDEIPY